MTACSTPSGHAYLYHQPGTPSAAPLPNTPLSFAHWHPLPISPYHLCTNTAFQYCSRHLHTDTPSQYPPTICSHTPLGTRTPVLQNQHLAGLKVPVVDDTCRDDSQVVPVAVAAEVLAGVVTLPRLARHTPCREAQRSAPCPQSSPAALRLQPAMLGDSWEQHTPGYWGALPRTRLHGPPLGNGHTQAELRSQP